MVVRLEVMVQILTVHEYIDSHLPLFGTFVGLSAMLGVTWFDTYTIGMIKKQTGYVRFFLGQISF